MSLDNQTRKSFRSIGHKLDPVVIVKVLSDPVNAEIDRALNDHELIKLKVLADDRIAKKAMVEEICRRHGAELVQFTGHVALVFRATAKPNPALSNLLRHGAVQ
jgi:RNA-binding protein